MKAGSFSPRTVHDSSIGAPVLTMYLAVISVLLVGVAHGAGTISPPSGGNDVVQFDRVESLRLVKKNVAATGQWVSIEGMPFRQAYRIESDTWFSDAENIQLIAPLRRPVRKGDVLLMSFWMRRPNAGGQPNNAIFAIDAGSCSETPGYDYQLSAYREWKQHVRPFVSPADFGVTQATVRFDLGEAGTIAEIADLRLVNYGADYDVATLPKSTVMYRGRAADSVWRQEALDRIERIRKGDLTIKVVDDQGAPIANARVSVAMQKHAFSFGVAVNSEVLGADQSDFPIQPKGKVSVTWADARQYREIVRRYFDRVTFESELRPGNWQKMNSSDPAWDRKRSILMNRTVPWLAANHIAARGHYIGWAPMDFNQIEKQFVGDPQGHRKWLWEHMADVLPRTAGFVTEWDTVNHIVGWGKHTYEAEYGGPEIYADILAEARRLAPNASHAINEGKVLPDGYKREPYKRVIRFLNENGQSPDLVGFMAHFGLTTLTPPEELLEVYDDFAEIAPRLQLTEFDVEVGDDETLQADYFRDVMIATFSHPNFEAIAQWGFWERMHWKPAAALWRDDWTLKPAGEVFVDLVTRQWRTDDTSATNAAGVCTIRGFLGKYKVTAESDEKTATTEVVLKPGGTQLLIRIK